MATINQLVNKYAFRKTYREPSFEVAVKVLSATPDSVNIMYLDQIGNPLLLNDFIDEPQLEGNDWVTFEEILEKAAYTGHELITEDDDLEVLLFSLYQYGDIHLCLSIDAEGLSSYNILYPEQYGLKKSGRTLDDVCETQFVDNTPEETEFILNTNHSKELVFDFIRVAYEQVYNLDLEMTKQFNRT